MKLLYSISCLECLKVIPTKCTFKTFMFCLFIITAFNKFPLLMHSLYQVFSKEVRLEILNGIWWSPFMINMMVNTIAYMMVIRIPYIMFNKIVNKLGLSCAKLRASLDLFGLVRSFLNLIYWPRLALPVWKIDLILLQLIFCYIRFCFVE